MNSGPTPVLRGGLLGRWASSLSFSEDYRARLPLNVSRFLGYRPPSQSPPYEPLPVFPFNLLGRISLRHEVWIFAFLGSLGSILLIEALMSTHTAFQDVYHSPLIISSFGASAVLVFGVIESPLAQPRNLVLGHFVSGLLSVAMTRLWILNGSYDTALENTNFYAPSFVNGGLCMSLSLLAQLVLGIVHPPGGATGLAAATEKGVVLLSWDYLPVLVTSAIIMLAWAMIVNNLGRRRYPEYWWTAKSSLVRDAPESSEQQILEKLEEGVLREAEDGGRGPEALYMDRMYTEDHPGENPRDRAFSRGSR
jgi:HPP family